MQDPETAQEQAPAQQSEKDTTVASPNRRKLLKAGGAAILGAPYISRAWASVTEINMLAWYGHGEPDVVAEYEAANNVKFKPKYYAGGDNMLALIAQSPPGTYDLILSDAEFVQQLNAAGYIEEMNAADYPFDDMLHEDCLLYTSPSPRDQRGSRMPSSA